MGHTREAIKDAGTLRWLAAVAAALFTIGARSPAMAGSAELCRQFDRECTEARAAGYRDVGICHVERLECSVDDDARVQKPSRETHDDDRRDPDASYGERSVGP